MRNRINAQKLLSYAFTLGLLLLTADFAINHFELFTGAATLWLKSVPLFAIGLVVCLTVLPFLLIEWMPLPTGTFLKRSNLYQGAGNVIALGILIGEYFLESNSSPSTVETASLTLSSGAISVALIGGWVGGHLVSMIARKRSASDIFDGSRTEHIELKNSRFRAGQAANVAPLATPVSSM